MFTWICPQCGGEVLPSQEECPRCAKLSKPVVPVAPAVVAPAPAVVAPAPAVVAPIAPAVPAAAAYEHPAEPRSTALRDLLVTVGVAAVLLGVGYFVWNRNEAREGKAEAPKTELENVKGGRSTHPLAKQIEVTGLRLRMPKPGQAEVQMVVVNHSAAEIAELSMDVVLGGKGSSKEVAAFPVKVKRLSPFGSSEVTARAKTEISAIDLPDWQFLEARVVIQANEP
jgi:hypothetical protein